MDSDAVIFIGLLAATSRWYIHYANSTAYRDLQVSGDATAVGVVMDHVQTHSTVVLGSVLRNRYTPLGIWIMIRSIGQLDSTTHPDIPRPPGLW